MMKMAPKSCCRLLLHHAFFLLILIYAAIQFCFSVAITSDKKDVNIQKATADGLGFDDKGWGGNEKRILSKRIQSIC